MVSYELLIAFFGHGEVTTSTAGFIEPEGAVVITLGIILFKKISQWCEIEHQEYCYGVGLEGMVIRSLHPTYSYRYYDSNGNPAIVNGVSGRTEVQSYSDDVVGKRTVTEQKENFSSYDKAGYINSAFGTTLGVTEYLMDRTIQQYATAAIVSGRRLPAITRFRAIASLRKLGNAWPGRNTTLGVRT